MANQKDRINRTIHHVKDALLDAHLYKSNVTKEVLDMTGMTGAKTRHFMNNLCNTCRMINYLEIGTWHGSSTISALVGNQDNVSATIIDNFSEFSGSPEKFITNVKKHLLEGHCQMQLWVADCFDFDVSILPSIDIYLYDGDHSYDAHYKAITYYAKCLNDVSIVVIDDWNWVQVRKATMAGICDAGLQIAYQHEITYTEDKKGSADGVESEFWNGTAVLVLVKPVIENSSGDYIPIMPASVPASVPVPLPDSVATSSTLLVSRQKLL